MKSLARAGDQAELRRRLRDLRPDAARRWGTMTVHQMVCHLGDAFGMALGRKAVTPASGLLQRTLVKWVALSAPLPWPAGIRTRPEIDQALALCTAPVAFDVDRGRVEALMEEMIGAAPGFPWPPHPIFGRLSPSDWMRWGYLHTDHHLRQFGA
jgi:hypothetical protein